MVLKIHSNRTNTLLEMVFKYGILANKLTLLFLHCRATSQNNQFVAKKSYLSKKDINCEWGI